MPKLKYLLESVESQDKKFIGTIAFRSEEIALPNGSKMALGIDDGHWVLVYQKAPHQAFQAYKYNQLENKIYVDQNPGGAKEFEAFRKHIDYFLSHAEVDDLVTLIPAKG